MPAVNKNFIQNPASGTFLLIPLMKVIVSAIGFCLIVLAGSSVLAEEFQERAIIAWRNEFFPKAIVVEKGTPVKLYLTGIDNVYRIVIPQFHFNQEIPKGDMAMATFTPNRVGTFGFSGDREMRGQVVVVEKLAPEAKAAAPEGKVTAPDEKTKAATAPKVGR